ncbi:MAG TPA: NAD-dependent epimerase/dehydratase family protein, partial [Sediminibacterium sp.]|nr:NAD-dependent epimerase/dehydratase family protein [Sediminibacterium sp.]
MKQILITGVAGMIGSKLAEYLLAHYPEYEVIGIDNLSGGYQENLPEHVRFHQLDLVTDSLDEV